MGENFFASRKPLGVSLTNVTPTPLPAALFFVAPALAGVFGFSRRKQDKA